jgi:ferredoxin-NADP reductase
MAVTQKLLCRVERIVDHGDRVYTVTLRPTTVVPRFRAGQFLHLALDPYDPTRFWPESRVFSIASSPSPRHLLRISYSVRGRFTTRMEGELVEGREVWIKMPYGDFFVDSHRDVVLFAGGTGITAFTAFIEGLAPSIPQSVLLVYGARTSRLLIYRDVVENCARNVPSLDVSYFVEQPGGTDPGTPNDPVRPHIGRLSVTAIWPQLRRPSEARYYISGPPAMLQAISRDLRLHGISGEHIHIDSWE